MCFMPGGACCQCTSGQGERPPEGEEGEDGGARVGLRLGPTFGADVD